MPSPSMNNVGGGVANQQIINGQHYTQYSPQWYAAMEADKVRKAGVAGTAAGTGVKNAMTAAGLGGAGGAGGAGTAGGGQNPGGSGTPSTIELGPGPGTPGGPGGSVGAPAIPSVAAIDTTAADNAVFNRAKDRVGQTSAGALAGLRSSLAGRGMLGSGAEYRGTVQVANEGQQQLGDTTREQAINDVNLARDTAFQNQNAALTGRGQDVSATTSRRGQDIERELGGYQGKITQRGQDITASMSAAARAQSQIASLMALLNGSAAY